jgi:hypothetical protein
VFTYYRHGRLYIRRYSHVRQLGADQVPNIIAKSFTNKSLAPYAYNIEKSKMKATKLRHIPRLLILFELQDMDDAIPLETFLKRHQFDTEPPDDWPLNGFWWTSHPWARQVMVDFECIDVTNDTSESMSSHYPYALRRVP